MSDLAVKKDDASGKYHVVREDGSIKSKHESEEKALKSIDYAKKFYQPKGRGKVN